MTRRVTIFACAALMLAPVATSQNGYNGGPADPSALRLLYGDELQETYSGKTYIGRYNPLSSESETTPLDFVETTHANGRFDYRIGGTHATGNWKASGDRICFQYDDNPRTVHCFREFILGNCIYSYGLNNSTVKGPIYPNAWEAKGIIKGDISTCDDVLG